VLSSILSESIFYTAVIENILQKSDFLYSCHWTISVWNNFLFPIFHVHYVGCKTKICSIILKCRSIAWGYQLVLLIAIAAWSFLARNDTHMYLLKSSTRRTMYLFPLGVAGLIGQHRSPCSSSTVLVACRVACCGNRTRQFFPARQDSHSCSTCSRTGNPCINSSFPIFLRAAKIVCLNRACHLHASPPTHASPSSYASNVESLVTSTRIISGGTELHMVSSVIQSVWKLGPPRSTAPHNPCTSNLILIIKAHWL
jgi:hypothetical protein